MKEYIEENIKHKFSSDERYRNTKKEIKSKSHFYLDTETHFLEQNEGFGVISNSQFRTTSVLNFEGTKKVYAICKSQILIQPQTDNLDKVNIILKPLEQPINSLNIKFIIYRGLLKSDFVENDLIVGNQDSGTHFIMKIWREFNEFYAKSKLSKPTFEANFIGYPTTSTPQNNLNKKLELFFEKKTDVALDLGILIENKEYAYELPIVELGEYIGNASDSLGIDIVIEENSANRNLYFDLNFARKSINILDTSNITNDFKKKIYKENILSFLDVACFLGAQENSKIYINCKSKVLKSPAEINDLVNLYSTKNLFYFYIFGARDRSYNFYNDFVKEINNEGFINLKIIEANNITIETLYETNSWPVYIFNLDQLVTNEFQFQLLLDPKCENCYLKSKSHLIDANEQDIVIENEELIPPTDDENIIFSSSVKIKLLDTSKKANFIILEYSGSDFYSQFNLLLDSSSKTRMEILNNLFSYNLNYIPIDSTNNFRKNVSSYFNGISSRIFISKSFYGKNLFNKAVFYQKIKKLNLNNEEIIGERVLFLTKLESNLYNKNQTNTALKFNTLNVSKLENENIKKFIYEDNYQIKIFKLNFDNYNEFCLFHLKQNEVSVSEFYHIGISKIEYDTLLSAIPINSTNNTLFINKENIETIIEESKNYNISKYSLGILVENSSGDLEIVYPNNKIYVYGLKDSFLVSKTYSEFEI